jgi:hypothetical protein
MDWTAILIAILGSGVLTTGLNFWFEKQRNEREVANQKNMRGFQDKLAIYRMIIDLIAEFLNDIAIYIENGTPISQEKIYHFNNLRMRTFGYLCIYADQEAIDAHEALIEYIYEVLEGSVEGEWAEVRNRAVRLLNSFRLDYDANLIPAEYNGNR